MNTQVQIQPTAAESALLGSFSSMFGQFPGDAGVTTQRSTLMQGIKVAGLPTRRREFWHYTDLRNLLKGIPSAAEESTRGAERLVEGSELFTVLNGVPTEKSGKGDISLKRFSESLADGSALKGLALRNPDDAIGRLNGSFVTDGYSLSFADNLKLEKPVEVQFAHAGGFLNTRMPVNFGSGTQATVIERHIATTGEASLVSHVTDLSLAEGADVTWVVLQQQGGEGTHLGQLRIRLGKDSKLKLYVINAGGKLVRQDIFVDVEGEGADLTLRGINMLGGESHTDVSLVLGHNVENTTSTEIMRNVVFDRARGVFQGQIRVAPGAQKTDARMACNTLLLSDDAEFSTKPELEIFADDVQCGHGATVADISDTHLFYLESRGIPEPRARALLVQAFLQETVEELEDAELIDALEGVIQMWLEKHA